MCIDEIMKTIKALDFNYFTLGTWGHGHFRKCVYKIKKQQKNMMIQFCYKISGNNIATKSTTMLEDPKIAIRKT